MLTRAETINREELAARYEAAGQPIIVVKGAGYRGVSVTKMIASDPVGYLEEIERQVASHEEQLRDRQSRQEQARLAEEARSAPAPAWAVEQSERMFREGAEAARRADSTVGRLDRIERQLGELRELIEKQR